MEIDKKDKVYIRNIQIETNTDCNLNCRHCYLGSKTEKITIKPEFIDALIANASGIDELTLLGGEITLHPETVEMVLDKLANSNLKINYINFVTNGVIKSEKIVSLFNWFRNEHTTNPNDAIFKISSDKFHTSCSPDFTKKELQESIEWYSNRCDSLVVSDYEFDTLLLSGNAKNIKREDIEEFEDVLFFNYVKQKSNKLDYKAKCNDRACENTSVFHCVKNLDLHADGYLYNGVPASPPLNERDYYNKSYSVGFILDDSLLNLITNYNKACEQNKTKTWNYIPVKDDSFSFLMLRWDYLVKKYILELRYFTLKDNPTFLDRIAFNKIDNEVVDTANKIKNYLEKNKESITPTERYLLSLYGKYGDEIDIFIKKIEQYKSGMISKSQYSSWSYDYIQKKIKPQSTEEEKTYSMMKALDKWDLPTYQKLFKESYSIITYN